MGESKEDLVLLMSIAFQEANKEAALSSGMSEEETNEFVEKSTPSIMMMLGHVYDTMIEKGVIK